jgi:chorismate mutase
MRTPLLALLLTPLLLTQGCASPPPPNNALQRVLNTVEHRLDFAEAVALSKWDSGQPVQAIEREQQVIAGAQAQAARFGIDGQRAAAVFADQIEANKLLQYSALSRWHAAGHAPVTPRIDLAKQLRPQLDRLQRTLLSDLAEFDRNRPESCPSALAQAIEQRETSPQQTLALIRATAHLCSPQ